MGHLDSISIKNKWVSDLHWVISSPSLIENNSATGENLILNSQWHQKRYKESIEWITELDKDPTPLIDWMDSSKDRRIGSLFERLLTFWLKFGPSPLKLIKNGLQIIEDKHTLGELDFIVFNEEVDEFWSIEVAVKFYIGIRSAKEMKDFVGPRVMDTLKRKWDHLLERQSRLHENPVAQETILSLTNGKPVVPKIYIKGRLFIPYDTYKEYSLTQSRIPLEGGHMGLCGGWWMDLDKADSYLKKAFMCELGKSFYFSPVSSAFFKDEESPFIAMSDFSDFFPPDKKIPRLFAIAEESTGFENSRGWIVPSKWPDSSC